MIRMNGNALNYSLFACLLVVLVLQLTSCAIVPNAGPILGPPVGGDNVDHLTVTVDRLAFLAGLAAIAIVAIGIFVKEYSTAVIGGAALAGLALVFLLLPAIAAVVKWIIIAAVVTAVGGVAWLAYSRWKTTVALRLTALHGDRMEAAETAGDVAVAKTISHAEQVQSGVAGLIEKIRGLRD